MANFQEGSSRINIASGYDFTSSGTTNYAPYTVVKLSSGTAVPVSAVTDAPLGVLYNCPDASGTADILTINQMGTGKITAGGSITAGALITFDNTGKAVAATQTAAGLQPVVHVIGRALEAGSAGKVIEYQSFYLLY